MSIFEGPQYLAFLIGSGLKYNKIKQIEGVRNDIMIKNKIGYWTDYHDKINHLMQLLFIFDFVVPMFVSWNWYFISIISSIICFNKYCSNFIKDS